MHWKSINHNWKNSDNERAQEIDEKIKEKLDKAHENLNMNKNTFKRNIILRQERENLRLQDAQKNIER